MSKYKIAVVGAITAVGRELLPVLQERKFPFAEIRLLGEDDEVGEKIEADDEEWAIEAIGPSSFVGMDLVFVPPNAVLSPELRAAASKAGAILVDASGAAGADAPLVFPGINDELLEEIESARGRAFAVASSSAAQLAAALLPLEAKAGLQRVDAVVLEAVSAFGVPGLEELSQQTVSLLSGKEPDRGVFPHRIAFNLIPHLGAFENDGGTIREKRIALELSRLLGRELGGLSVTCAVAPVFYGTTQFVTVETARPLEADAAREAIASAEELKVLDDPQQAIYPMPMLAVGDEALHVGRVRRTPTGLSFLSVADNLRWGTVVPMVRVAELLVEAEAL